ncbi:hypothetical protein D3C81_1691510 [compost metagenome]
MIGGEGDATGPGALPFHRFEVREIVLLHAVGPGLEEPGRFLIAITETAKQQATVFVSTDTAEHLAGVPGTLATGQNLPGGFFGQRHRGHLIVITGEEIAPQLRPVAFGVGIGGNHHFLGHDRALGSLY